MSNPTAPLRGWRARHGVLVVGLAMTGVLAVGASVAVAHGHRATLATFDPRWALALVPVLFAFFAVTFAINTVKGIDRIGWRGTGLLVVQLGLAFVLDPDLIFIVAGQVAVVLRGKLMFVWMAGQLIAVTTFMVLFLPGAELSSGRVPSWFTTMILIFETVGWQCFLFLGGWVVAVVESRGEALRAINAQLIVAQRQLAEHARLAERLALSRELHDGVGHHLVALSVNLDLARHQCTNAEARATVSIARELAQRALSESRTVVDVLRASDPFDLEGALQALAYETVTPRIEVDTALASPLTSDVAHAVLRCAQEGVTNALKHAHASRIRITVEEIDAEVRVRIEDDGIGRLPLTEGNGIRGLRERATLLHGRLSIAARTPGLCLMLCLPRNSVAS